MRATRRLGLNSQGAGKVRGLEIQRLGMRLMAALMVSLVCVTATARAADPEDHGLQRHGRFWIFPEELQLREKVTLMNDLARRIAISERQYGLMVSDNQQLWQRHQQTTHLIDQLALHLKARAVGTDEEKRLAGQIEQLKNSAKRFHRAVSPEHLGSQPHARSILEEISSSRQEFSLTLFSAVREIRQLRAQYASLPSALRAQLSRGDGPQLGPLVAFSRMQQSLDRLEPLALSAEVPILTSGKQSRVVTLLNEQTPAMLTIVPKMRQIVITSNTAQAAGISLTDQPMVEFQVPRGGPKVQARIAKILSVHVGGSVHRHVEVLVLPPPMEHLGGFLGLSFLQAHDPQVDLVRSQLKLDGSAFDSTAGR